MLSVHGLRQRSALLQGIRSFFIGRGYIEVDTPVRLPVLIPEAHIKPFSCEGGYLHTSPEMCMKLLLARGCEQLFQLCHCFRKEEKGRLHVDEFTMLEWYHRDRDYTDLMIECEELFYCLVQEAHGLAGVNRQGQLVIGQDLVSLTPPWERISVAEAFGRYAGVSVAEALQAGRFDQVLVEDVEPHLGWEAPVFLHDYPLAMASLSRAKKDNPELAERFELYIGGIELANGFSELVDPVVQRQRFEEEYEKMESKEAAPCMPELFLANLDQISAAAGIALGLDRLLMLLMGRESVQEVLPFSGDDLL
ncbi:MAG: EF-P lysine aminoacylase GenX [Desulfobulbus propionicus]|nr:MAG: EF-P lysine aminoacylase GenX [Desulfobulbus propionicus]